MYSTIEERICYKRKGVAHDKQRGKPVTLDELLYILNEYLTSSLKEKP